MEESTSKTTEKYSIWDVIKSFFAVSNDTPNEEEIKQKVSEIEKQEDENYIKSLTDFVTAKPEEKSKKSKAKFRKTETKENMQGIKMQNKSYRQNKESNDEREKD